MRITKFGHACVRIEHEGQVVVLDPGMFTDPEAVDGATAVLVTHLHPDHLHPDNLRATDAPVFTVGQVAEQLAADAPISYSKAYVIANASRFWTLAGDRDRSIESGREALAMAEELGLEELKAHALNNIGISRTQLGDAGGFEDLERSAEIAPSSWCTVEGSSLVRRIRSSLAPRLRIASS